MSRTVMKRQKEGLGEYLAYTGTGILLSGSLSDWVNQKLKGKVLSSPHTAIFIDSIYSTSPGSHFLTIQLVQIDFSILRRSDRENIRPEQTW